MTYLFFLPAKSRRIYPPVGIGTITIRVESNAPAKSHPLAFP
jgi:hypothetical protein